MTHQWECFCGHKLYLDRNSSSRAALSTVYERVNSRSWVGFWILPALRQHSQVKIWMLLIRITVHSQRYVNQMTISNSEQTQKTSMFLVCSFLKHHLNWKSWKQYLGLLQSSPSAMKARWSKAIIPQLSCLASTIKGKLSCITLAAPTFSSSVSFEMWSFPVQIF